MGKLENEIVRFIAEIDLDPQMAAKFTEGLKEAEGRCSSLRNEISATKQKLEMLRAQGKGGSGEAEKLDGKIRRLVEDLKEATKKADQFSSALSINQMSFNQLTQHAKQLRNAINNTHKEANPKVWKKYNKELQLTLKRMRELQSGAMTTGQKLLAGFRKGLPAITAAGAAIAVVRGIVKGLKAAFKTAIDATQVWGDKFQEITKAVKAGWTQFIRDLTLGHGIQIKNIKEAAATAKAAQKIRDENFERENSYRIQEVKMRKEINQLETEAYDKSKSASERLKALEKAVEKEKQLADMRKENAKRMRDAALMELESSTKLTEQEIESFVENYQLDQEKIDAAGEYNDLIKERDKLVSYIEDHEASTNKKTVAKVKESRERLEELNAEIRKVPENIAQIGSVLAQYNWGNDEQFKNYVEATVSMLQADADSEAAEKDSARKKAQLQQQMYNEALTAANTQYTLQLNALKISLQKQEITQEEYNERSFKLEIKALERRQGVVLKYSKDIAGLEGEAASIASQILDKQLSHISQETAALDKGFRIAQNALKTALLDGEISQEEYNRRNTELEGKLLEDKKELNEKYGQDVSAIEGQILDHRLSIEEQATELLETAFNKQLLSLKEKYAKGEISQEEYNARTRSAELAHLEQLKAIRIQYGHDITDIDAQILEKRTALQQQFRQLMVETERSISEDLKQKGVQQVAVIQAVLQRIKDSVTGSELTEEDIRQANIKITKLKKLIDSSLKDNVSTESRVSASEREFGVELANLDEMHDLQLISEQEYLARRKQLHEEHSKEIIGIRLAEAERISQVSVDFMTEAASAVSALQEASLAQIDAQMKAELAAAGDNAEERERIEAEYEAKKLETQKKYADVDMAINIAKTIAAGALAAIQSFAQLGPIAGAVMAAVIGVTTASEVATIVAQRNAIKNASASSTSGTVSTTGSVGFSEGGYTGDGGRLQVAGVVHRGEYVVAAPELRDPYVARQIAGIERMRLARTGGKSRYQGFADGGYTIQGQQPGNTGNEILEDIYSLLTAIAGNPIPAYVVLSDLETKYDESNRFKSVTSLRKSSR